MLRNLFKFFKNQYVLWKFIFFHFYKDQCFLRAGALSFTTLLALVPFLITIFSVLSFFPFFDQASLRLQHFAFVHFIPSSGVEIENYLIQFQREAHRLPIYSFLFLFMTAFLLMTEMEANLNAVLRLGKLNKQRHLSLSILIHWCLLLIGPLFITASVFLSSYLDSFEFLDHFNFSFDLGLGQIHSSDLWIYLLPGLCTFIAFSFLYLVIPGVRVNFRNALLGAFLATIFFELSKSIFRFYLACFPTYSLLYGAMAVIPIFLVWVFIAWSVFLLGAEVIKGLGQER